MSSPASGPLIDLSLASGHVGNIIEWSSGVRYTTQTVGTACLHPEVEGVLALLTDDHKKLFGHLTEHFVDTKNVPTWMGISEATAALVDDLMQGYSEHRGISVDRKRLAESHEAWIHVDIVPIDDAMPLFANFGVAKGVLTWENSD